MDPMSFSVEIGLARGVCSPCAPQNLSSFQDAFCKIFQKLAHNRKERWNVSLAEKKIEGTSSPICPMEFIGLRSFQKIINGHLLADRILQTEPEQKVSHAHFRVKGLIRRHQIPEHRTLISQLIETSDLGGIRSQHIDLHPLIPYRFESKSFNKREK